MFVNQQGISVNELDPLLLSQECRCALKRGRKQVVIRVEPGDVVPACPSPALVDGLRLTSISLAHPVGKPSFIFADNINAAIWSVSIHDDVFYVGISLQKDRPNRLFDELS